MKIGVISDTHGYLHPKVFEIFSGVSHILHAGDIDCEEVMIELRVIAPVTAVHGNMDDHQLAARYPEKQIVQLKGVRIGLIHGDGFPTQKRLPHLKNAFGGEKLQVIVFGHTHRPEIRRREGVLFFNPGAAGKGEFIKAPSVGILRVKGGGDVQAEVRYL